MMKFAMNSFPCVNTTGIIAVSTAANTSYKHFSIFTVSIYKNFIYLQNPSGCYLSSEFQP